MIQKIFTKEEWIEALERLKLAYSVFIPVKDGDFHTFKLMQDGDKPDFAFLNSRLSPKSVLYPQSERLFEYSIDENDPESDLLKEFRKDYSARVIVGIRPCDVKAFQIVRANFDNPEYQDPWWVQRFQATVLVGLGCNQPAPTCFCTEVESGPFDEKGLDVLLFDLDDNIMAKALTDKGEKLLQDLAVGVSADEAVLKKSEGLKNAACDLIKTSFATDHLAEKPLLELFEAPFWDDVAFGCINCGTCTFLCPTCWCFDIQDEVIEKEGDRIRNWDSCMFPLFTLHGSGHNPRSHKVQRVRQRFMHKLKYYVDKYNNGVQCSGCGRCVRYCPVNIDIRQVCELMNNFEKQPVVD